MVAMADVTIYSMECNFCEDDYETMDYLVRHLVNDHDELWDYEKITKLLESESKLIIT